MIEWVLIIMLFNDGRAVGDVPGFKTEGNCEFARQKVIHAGNLDSYNNRVIAVCVPR